MDCLSFFILLEWMANSSKASGAGIELQKKEEEESGQQERREDRERFFFY
jgi:hypothetical protein